MKMTLSKAAIKLTAIIVLSLGIIGVSSFYLYNLQEVQSSPSYQTVTTDNQSRSTWNNTFTGNQNITFWITLPKQTSVINAKLNLSGYKGWNLSTLFFNGTYFSDTVATAMDGNGVVHFAFGEYEDINHNWLFYGNYSGGILTIENTTLRFEAGVGDEQAVDIAINLSSNEPYIVFSNISDYLTLVKRVSGVWSQSKIDTASMWYLNIQFFSNNNKIGVLGHNGNDNTVTYYEWSGSGWSKNNLVPEYQVGRTPTYIYTKLSSLVYFNDYPQIIFDESWQYGGSPPQVPAGQDGACGYDYYEYMINYTFQNSTGWFSQMLYNTSCWLNDLKMSFNYTNGKPIVSFLDEPAISGGFSLRYVYWNGTDYIEESVNPSNYPAWIFFSSTSELMIVNNTPEIIGRGGYYIGYIYNYGTVLGKRMSNGTWNVMPLVNFPYPPYYFTIPFDAIGGIYNNSRNYANMIDETNIKRYATFRYNTEIDANNSMYFLSENYPTNSYLDVSGNSTHQWSFSGEFTQSNNRTVNFSSQITNYLSTCSSDNNGNCDVPIVLHSDAGSIIQISDINITYENPPVNISQVNLETLNLGGSEQYLLVVNYTGGNINFWNFGGLGTQTEFTNSSLVLNLGTPTFPIARNLTINNTANLPSVWNVTISFAKSGYYQNHTGTTNNYTYQFIAYNASYENDAPAGFPISVSFSISPPPSSTLVQGSTAINNIQLDPLGGTNASKAVWRVQYVSLTPGGWVENTTGVSHDEDTQNIKETETFSLSQNVVNFTSLYWIVTPPTYSGNTATCDYCSGTDLGINYSSNSYKTAKAHGDWVTSTDYGWIENTNFPRNESYQHINQTINLANNATIQFTSISWSRNAPTWKGTAGTCDTCSGTQTLTSGANNNVTLNAHGKWILHTTIGSWVHNTTDTTSITHQGIKRQENITSIANINFTNIGWNTTAPTLNGRTGTCTYCSDTISQLNANQTNTSFWSAVYGDWIDMTQGGFVQDNSLKSVEDAQYLNETETFDNVIGFDFNNVYWTISTPSFGGQSSICDICSGTLNVPNGYGSASTTAKVHGDWVTTATGSWVQNTTASSNTNVQYMKKSVNLTSIFTDNFNQIELNTPTYSASGVSATCSNCIQNTTISYSSTRQLWVNATGDWVNITYGDWVQDTSSTSNTTKQYFKSTITVGNNATINFASINWTAAAPTWNSITGNADQLSNLVNVNSYQTTVDTALTSNDWVAETEGGWRQDNSTSSNNTHQFVNETYQVQNTAAPTLTNLQYSVNPPLSSFTCSNCIGTFTSSITGGGGTASMTVIANGDALNEHWNGFLQNTSQTTEANGTAYIYNNISWINNSLNIPFTNINIVNSTVSDWTCTNILVPTIGASANFSSSSANLACSKDNIITMSLTGTAYNETNITFNVTPAVTGNFTATANNTFILVNFTNVKINVTKIMGAGWTNTTASVFTSSTDFNAPVSQSANYSLSNPYLPYVVTQPSLSVCSSSAGYCTFTSTVRVPNNNTNTLTYVQRIDSSALQYWASAAMVKFTVNLTSGDKQSTNVSQSGSYVYLTMPNGFSSSSLSQGDYQILLYYNIPITEPEGGGGGGGGKSNCPYNCCVNEASYYDKLCGSGLVCLSNRTCSVSTQAINITTPKEGEAEKYAKGFCGSSGFTSGLCAFFIDARDTFGNFFVAVFTKAGSINLTGPNAFFILIAIVFVAIILIISNPKIRKARFQT